MLIRKLTMSNFRQFKNEETIEFATNKDSNITLILGENTSGKTTILQAFLWCLYGKANFKRGNKLFNEENATTMAEGEKGEISVTVEIEHLDRLYIFERTQECVKQGGIVSIKSRPDFSVFMKNEKGELDKIEDYNTNTVVSEMLPNDLAEYFFYDTERFGNITDKKDVTSAVKGLLGLTVLENALKHLGTRHQKDTVINGFFREINMEGNEEFQNINEKIQKVQENIDTYKENIETYIKEIDRYEEMQQQKEEELKNYAETEKIKELIDDRRSRKNKKQDELRKTEERFLKDFNRNTLSYFISPLINEVKDFLGETEIHDDFITGMDATSIDHIIERGKCVCGTKIEKNSQHYKELKKTLKYIPPQSLGNVVKNYENLFQIHLENADEFYDSVDESYGRLNKIELTIQNLDEEITAYEKSIGDFERTKRIKKEIDDYRAKTTQLNEIKIRTEERLKHAEEKLRKLNTNAEKLIQLNEKNQELMNLLKYAEAVKDYFQKDFDTRSDKVRQDLEERVNKYFKQIYHGNRLVRIDDRYRVELYSVREGVEYVTDESAGLETVKNFAYIAGLVDLAKEKLTDDKAKNEDELIYGLEEDYPLVLDAAFSNVDEQHVINISKVLPEVAGQLILIVMDKDWNYAAKELDHLVGVKYRLNKKTETYTKVAKE